MSTSTGGRKSLLQHIRYALILVAGAFHVYTATFGMWISQKPIHMGLFLVIMFLGEMDRALKGGKRLWFAFCTGFCLLSVAVGVFLSLYYNVLTTRLGSGRIEDTLVGVATIILVMVFAYRTLGPVLPLVSAAFIVYAYFGPYFPGMLAHRGFSFTRLVTYLPFSADGIMGSALSASAKFIVVYLIFGATLELCGGGQFFIDFANALIGGRRGGPAKAAVISSALMGSISGSAIANVAGTGAFTIPLMKKSGYSPEFAGAVEASASTGGQITPPVMASAAFIMAEMLGVSYGSIIIAAILPAILYYFSVFLNVDMEAAKRNLKGLPKDSLPLLWPLLKRDGYLLLPVVLLVIAMGVLFLSPQRAGIYAVYCSLILSLLRKETRVTLKKLGAILENGITGGMSVVSACACSGIIVGVVTGTGLGSVLSRLVTRMAMGDLSLALVFTAIAVIILGMGMPTIPAYVIPAVMLVPVLTGLGAAPMGAHLFVLFFASMSGLTPPVALTSYTAAGIAESSFMKTSMLAFQIALAGFTMPFVFVLQPGLLLNGTLPEIVQAFAVCALGLFGIAACCRGRMFSVISTPERIACLVAGLLLIETHLMTDVIGFALLAAVALVSYRRGAPERAAGRSLQ